MVLVQMWDHFRNGFFKDILFLGSFPIVIPIVNFIANLDHEGVEPSFWKKFWLFSEPKDKIKKTWVDMFGCFWQKCTRPTGHCILQTAVYYTLHTIQTPSGPWIWHPGSQNSPAQTPLQVTLVQYNIYYIPIDLQVTLVQYNIYYIPIDLQHISAIQYILYTYRFTTH